MTNTKKIQIELADLDQQYEVTLHGKPVKIEPVNGILLQKLEGMEVTSNKDLYEKAHLFLPEMTEEEVMKLSLLQIKAVINIAANQLDELYALFPNLNPLAQTTAATTVENQGREIPSDTSSIA